MVGALLPPALVICPVDAAPLSGTALWEREDMDMIIQPSFTTIVFYLGAALLLSTLIGLEREYRQKSAGLRTNTLVGLGAALFMVISKYGFFDLLQPGVSVDPSRVAAQIVTGIGFIGGGIIFVKRSDVRGLTTAAGVWLTAAVGAAAGAGLLAVAAVSTAAYYLVAFGYPYLVIALRERRSIPWQLHLEYIDGHGVLRAALAEVSRQGFEIGELSVSRDEPVLAWAAERGPAGLSARAIAGRERHVFIDLELAGKGSAHHLADALGDLDGMLTVRAEDPREESR
jgi:putative Mg2+ transporter-C (MgtC) family protein